MRERIAVGVIAVVSGAVVAGVGALFLGGEPGGAAARDVSALPALDAALNATCAALLVAGWVAIRRGNVAAHRACMLTAVGVSAAFLLSYVTYHALAGSRPFPGHGLARAVYLPLLLSHIVLAAVMVPFVLTTLYRALRADFVRHRRVARRTLPVWLYVSVTGVLVYWLLYHVRW